MNAQELEIFRRSREIVLREPEKNLAHAFELLTALPDRHPEPPQVRAEKPNQRSNPP